MSKPNLPVFITYVRGDSDYYHLSVGIKPITLCFDERVVSAKPFCGDDPKQYLDERRICPECLSNWHRVRDKFNVLETSVCDACGEEYGLWRLKILEHMTAGQCEVCKVCYDKIKDENDAVDKDFSEAESVRETSGDKRFDLDKHL